MIEFVFSIRYKGNGAKMLREDIQKQMIAAMKSKEKVRLEALRFLWSEIKNAEIDAKSELNDDEVMKIIRREVKKRSEAMEQMEAAGREEMVAEEAAKLSVIEEFVEEMSEDDIGVMVDQVVNEGVKDFGQVMKRVMGLTQGKADGRKVSEAVKKKLGS